MLTRTRVAASVIAALGGLATANSAQAALPVPSAVADAYLRIYDFTILQGNEGATKSNNPIIFTPYLPDGATLPPGALAPLGIPEGTLLPSTCPTGSVCLDLSSVIISGAAQAGIKSPAPAIMQTVGGAITPAQVIAATIGYQAVSGTPDTAYQPTTAPVITLPGVGNAYSQLPDYVGSYQPTTLFETDTLNQSFAFAHGSSKGNALDPTNPDNVPVHSLVVLNNNGDIGGSSNASQGLQTKIQLTITTPQLFELNFMADAFLRAALGQEDISAKASHNWSAKITQTDLGSGFEWFSWSPQGAGNSGTAGNCDTFPGLSTIVVGGVTKDRCTVYADDFDLNNEASQTDASLDQRFKGMAQSFDAELWLDVGTYEFSITHGTIASATVKYVPEPGSLALLGLGLLGLGVSARMRNSALQR